jgi:rSAM/selenodomain-associated transferase 1
MRPVAILFAKAPVAGRVKTRLCPPLTPEAAARLHEAFTADVLATLSLLDADIELHTDIGTDAWPEFDVTRKLQYEGDLGLRMFHALRVALEEGRPRAMIVGADLPHVSAAQLGSIFQGTADVSLGPTDDGGYYAIAASRVVPEMFAGVEWSTHRTLDQTVAACRAVGLSVELGPASFDVDTIFDLDRLFAMAELPPHTARWRNAHAHFLRSVTRSR